MNEPSNLIAIGTRLNEAAPVEVLQERYDACHHEHASLHLRLRTVTCRDCGEERLDPFEVLVGLARKWTRWQYEAAELRKLRAEWKSVEREKWERSRDRHLTANPSHSATFLPGRNQWSGAPPCRVCYGLEVRWNSRWEVTRGPEPPPGKLEPPQP